MVKLSAVTGRIGQGCARVGGISQESSEGGIGQVCVGEGATGHAILVAGVNGLVCVGEALVKQGAHEWVRLVK